MNESKTFTLKQGTVLDDKWIIIEMIGKGAMGEVYRAHQTNLNRDVAIKIISEDVISEIGEDPEELDIAFGRFQREVQTMAKVRHANILTIYDYGEAVGGAGSAKYRTAYIAMEYIPGDSLRFTLSEDGLDDVPELYAEWIKNYFLPVLDGIETLHNNKIIHRDLKPENIFLDGEVPKIADFGLARSQHMKAVTCSIEMLGTLAYMSPEQCADFKYAGYTTDIYALGKILYEAVNGTLSKKAVPFTSVKIENPETDFLRQMSGVIEKATAEKPENRYQTVQELRSDLKHILASIKGESSNSQIRDSEADHSGKILTDRKIKIFGAGIILLIAIIAAIDFYDLVIKTDPAPGLEEKTYIESSEEPAGRHTVTVENDTTLAKSLLAMDGSQMVLTGDVRNGSDQKFLFYMDNRKITNFLFFEFLHNIEKEVSVKNGIVRHEGKIVIYIGDGSAVEDPIIFNNDTFHLKNQDDASKPVLRVTFHGAKMYAKQYGKELLTDKEWQFGYQYQLKNSTEREPVTSETTPQTNFNMMMYSGPPVVERKERPGVLDNMGKTVKEWVRITRFSNSQAESLSADIPASGVMDASRVKEGRKPLLRFPWEGFEDVGFRTKIAVIRK
ncbi:MAG: serine/threonine protein kinase [Deltaproteobacteria bacterium]|nr:serine/threonine protein kinase [Deltaproteobacteria bacterium]